MAAHSFSLSEIPPGIGLPKEFRIFRFGPNESRQGTFYLDEQAADEIYRAWKKHGIDLGIDYEHQSLSDPPVKAPAAGWFDVEVRADGLYAVNVRWTGPAAAHLRSAEYRFFSPAFETETRKDGQRYIQRIVNMALTNLPATDHQQALIAARESLLNNPAGSSVVSGSFGGVINGYKQEIEQMEPKALNAALGLKADAKEAEALGEVIALRSLHVDIVKLTGAKNIEEAFGTVAAWKASHEKVPQLNEQISALVKEAVTNQRTALIERAVSEGKIAPKDEKTQAFALTLSTEQLSAFIDTLQVSAPTSLKQRKVVSSETVLQDDAQELVRRFGVTPEQIRNHKVRG
jgi:phage I-like protein